MIKRELYMSRIRPFIGGELIKVMTGIRRRGKSAMLDLIKEELVEILIGEANQTYFQTKKIKKKNYSN